MKEADEERWCPLCSADLLGEEIPEEHREKYYGGSTHYSRRIGVEVPGVYDGVLYWLCPDCGKAWNRWSSSSGKRYTVAQDFIRRNNDSVYR